MERAALYIRVSTEDQAEFSPDAQKAALMAYARDKNWQVLDEHIFIDEGYSGRKAEKRPAFMRMIGMAKVKPKPFDVILTHKFDRFARNREDSILYKSALQRDCGVSVISITEPIDKNDKISILIEALLEAMAEYYSINLAEEVKKGMKEKAQRGEFQTSPPLGYRIAESRLTIVPEEAEHIRYIFEQYTYENKGPFAIARSLNQMGGRTKRGNRMDSRGVRYILSNPIYIGKVRWTPTTKAGRNFSHPDTIILPGSHEPLISFAIFEEAQKKLNEKNARTKRKAQPATVLKHWLSGLLRCSNCGSSLVLCTTAPYPSYQCHAYAKSKCLISHSITVKKMEKTVLDTINDLMQPASSHGIFEKNLLNICKTKAVQQETDLLRKQMTQIDKRIDRIREAYQSGDDTLAEYSAAKSKYQAEKQNLRDRIQSLENLAINARHAYDPPRFANVVELLKSDCALEQKVAAARSVIEKIIYDKPHDAIEIYLRGEY